MGYCGALAVWLCGRVCRASPAVGGTCCIDTVHLPAFDSNRWNMVGPVTGLKVCCSGGQFRTRAHGQCIPACILACYVCNDSSWWETFAGALPTPGTPPPILIQVNGKESRFFKRRDQGTGQRGHRWTQIGVVWWHDPATGMHPPQTRSARTLARWTEESITQQAPHTNTCSSTAAGTTLQQAAVHETC